MATPDYAEAFRPCMHFNSLYCEKYGYNHICTTPPLPSVHSGFQKPYRLLQEIHKFDYVMWVDIDASIINHETKIEDIINIDPDRDIWYCDDPGAWRLNSGVLIFKNSIKGIDLLWDWWGKCNLSKKWGRGSDGDQVRLEEILYPDYKKPLDIFGKTALEERVMNSFPTHYRTGDFLIHFMGYDTKDVGQHMNFLVNSYSQNLDYVGKYLELLAKVLPNGSSRVKNKNWLRIAPEDIGKKIL